MLFTLLLGLVAAFVLLTLLAAVGRIAFVKAITNIERTGTVVQEFHQDLVAYANSKGQDQSAFHRLATKSASVESALGWDNVVHGVRVGVYMLNNAPLLPIGLQEMRREYSDDLGWRDDGGEIADAIQTMLFRHLGRRMEWSNSLRTQADSFWSCAGRGWSALAAIPISILSVFGLLSEQRANAARQSLLFRLWNLMLALAAFSGPLMAYIVDRDKIDTVVLGLWPFT